MGSGQGYVLRVEFVVHQVYNEWRGGNGVHTVNKARGELC